MSRSSPHRASHRGASMLLAAALALSAGLAAAQPATPPAEPQGGGMGGMHGGGMHGMHGGRGGGDGATQGGGGMHGGGMHGQGGGMHGGGMHGMGGGGMQGGGMHGMGGPTHLGRMFEHALRDARPSDEQQRQIDRVVEATRKKNWPLFDQVLEERARLKALHAAQPRDLKAIKASYRKLADVQLRIAENRLDAFDEIGRLLSADQRKSFEAHLARHFSH